MNTKQRIICLIKTYILIFTGFSLSYLFLFHTPLLTSQHVLFYRGVLLLVVISIIWIALILWYCLKISAIFVESMIAAFILAISINLSVFVLFPVSIERSVSVFLLNSLAQGKQQSCHGLSKQEMQNKLIDEYVIGKDGIGKRIEEQSTINMIQNQLGCYQLTSRGNQFLSFSEVIKTLYNIRK